MYLCWGRIQKGKKPLEKPPENQLDISYTGKSPKIGKLSLGRILGRFFQRFFSPLDPTPGILLFNKVAE